MHFDKKDKVLVVAAHPDDEVLGCGGTIASLIRKGIEVRILFLAEGISARFPKEKIKDKKVKYQIEYRNLSALKAMRILGIKKSQIFFQNFRCLHLDQISILEITKKIEKHVYNFKPTIIFSHYQHDVNNDHIIVNKALLAATRPFDKKFLRDIYSFEILSSTEWNFSKPFPANCFFDISNTISKKISALKAYKKEYKKSPHPRSVETVKALAVFRGSQVGLKYAEAFSLIRSIKI